MKIYNKIILILSFLVLCGFIVGCDSSSSGGGGNPPSGDGDDTTKYTVTFDLMGGVGTIAPIEASLNEEVTLPSVAGITNPDVTLSFKEWNTDRDGNGTAYNPNDRFIVTGNVTIYAIWWVITDTTKYTVTFDLMGGVGTIAPIEALLNEEISLPSVAGITNPKGTSSFKEWNTESNGSGTVYNPESKFKVTGNVTIYAIWVPIEYNAAVYDATTDFYIVAAKQLQDIAALAKAGKGFAGKKIIIETDIDMAGVAFSGIDFNSANKLQGEFIGNKHTISNINILADESESAPPYRAFIAYIGPAGSVKDINIEGTINSVSDAGGVVYSNEGLIENVTFSGSVTAENRAGGIATISTNGTIKNVINNGTIKSKLGLAGGIVAENSGLINNATNYGAVSSDDNAVGGIAGHSVSDIENVINFGKISSTTVNDAAIENQLVGGIVGIKDNGNITKAFNMGTVISRNNIAGGIVGDNIKGNITNAFNMGNVSNSQMSAAGIVGVHKDGSISNVINTGKIVSDGTSSYGASGIIYKIHDDTVSATLKNAINIGEIYGSDEAAGIIYTIPVDQVSKTYNIGKVTGKDNNKTGGLFGAIGTLTDTKLYFLKDNNINTGINAVATDAMDLTTAGKTVSELEALFNSFETGWVKHGLNFPINGLNSLALPEELNNTVVFIKAEPNDNDGTANESRIIVGQKGSLILPNDLFTAPEGKTFKEWNTQADGLGTSYKAKETLDITTDMTIFAIWQ